MLRLPDCSARRPLSGARPPARRSRLPGLALCLLVAGLALAAGRVEAALTGQAWLEPLVLAILLGTAIRTAWTPSARWHPGIAFSAHTLLELAVVLLGASVSAETLLAVGPALLGSIVAIVPVAILLSVAIGRLLGLSRRMAILVACGNSICGNSAIAAVAPVIGAEADDVAAAIAFTAVLGVAVVLGLPLLGHGLGMTAPRYGALAGLTVYAVPQVLAAGAPFGAAAVQMGTLVKLVRVLMLGPVCLTLSLLRPRRLAPMPQLDEGRDGRRPAGPRPTMRTLVPGFILGFLALAAARSLGLVPPGVAAPANALAGFLTIVAMAALGLGVNLRTVARAGGRVTLAVILSLFGLGAISLLALGWIGLA